MIACSILIWVYDNDKSFDGDKADNITALVVCAIILAIALYVLYETVVQIKEEIRKRRTERMRWPQTIRTLSPDSRLRQSLSVSTRGLHKHDRSMCAFGEVNYNDQ